MIYHRYEPSERSDDPLAASLLLATAVHAFVILGVSFSFPEPYEVRPNLPTLDITMVPSQSVPAPEDPDYFASTNQEGAADAAQQPPQPEIVAGRPSSAAARQSQPTQLLTAKQAKRKEQRRLDEASTTASTPTATQLIDRSLELVSLTNQSEQWATSDADELKHTFVTARTREHKFANYMAAWVAKVERVGNLNYPDQARRNGVSGTLLLDVALNADGSIRAIKLLRSSGQEVLDEGARRIVKLAAPFAPFPPEIGKETDILHITRTWEFLKTNRLHGR